MKKVIFTLLMLCATKMVFSQGTYYWVGGAAGSFTASASWNTALNGSGTARSSFTNTDVLIFDGTNIGGVTPATGTVTPDVIGSTSNIGQLKLMNTAIVVLRRNASGSSTYTIMGDATTSDDFTIDATSSLTITSAVSTQGFSLQMGTTVNNSLTGRILGTVRLDDGGFAGATNARLIDSCGVGSLVFASGSNLFFNNRSSATSYGFAGSVTRSIKFELGANFIYQGGVSRIYESTHFPLQFDKGSTFIIEAYPASPSSNTIVGSRVFSNVIVRNNATVTLNDNPFNIDDLTITTGSTLLMRTTNSFPVAGNITNNGTFGAAPSPTSSVLLMVGTTPQTIGGTGTFNAIGSLHVATGADVTLNTSLTMIGASNASTTGKLNTQTFTISGTAPFQLRTATTANSMATVVAESHTVTLADATAYGAANVASGALVTGPGIQPNTFVIATNSTSFSFTISKPGTISSTPLGAAITITNNAATLTTSHPNGVDGTITTSGTKTFGTGSNYVFNAATTAPFSISTNNATGNVTFNAACTTNKNQSIGGVLTLGTGKLTIRSSDTLRLTTPTDIAGAPFSSTKYIVTERSGAAIGAIRMDGLTSAELFPIGSTNNYLPVTLTPTSLDTFTVNVYEGATVDGTPNGTALNAAQKAGIVDAVWNINRNSSNTNVCSITTGFVPSLEGSSFATLANNQIGISRYDGTAWTVATGSGDNTANTATNTTYSSFGAFGVGQAGFTLPVKITAFTAKENLGKINLQWTIAAELNVQLYIIEKSTDGRTFTELGTVLASNKLVYAFMDLNITDVNFYRLKIIDKSNSIEYSNIIKIKLNAGKAELSVYPNPVKNKTLNVQLNSLHKGKTSITIYNSIGQTVVNQSFNFDGGSLIKTVALPANCMKGIYTIVVNNKNEKLQQIIVVE